MNPQEDLRSNRGRNEVDDDIELEEPIVEKKPIKKLTKLPKLSVK